MKIEKYKKLKNGKYEVILTNNEKLELYEDVILKFNLLLTKEIDDNKQLILDFNTECETYYIALKYLKVRPRSKKEIYGYLKKKDYPIMFIDKSLQKLENQGYINDLSFARSFLNNKLITTSNGPYKIRQELQNKGINNKDIVSVMEDYTLEKQTEKIDKQVNRMVKSNHNKGNNLLKKKIYMTLIQDGFDSNLINEAIDEIKFEDDQVLAKKEYDKLYKKLSTKYSGNELEYRIKQKLYQKGFVYKQ